MTTIYEVRETRTDEVTILRTTDEVAAQELADESELRRVVQVELEE